MATNDIQQLRAETGAGVMDVKRALEEAGGDIEKARETLRKRGAAVAAKKGAREAGNGIVSSYIHAGEKIGVLLKLYTETDFVARTAEFHELAHSLAMHIAASSPQYISEQDIPQEVLETERRIYREQFADSGKPAEVMDKVIEGKIAKFAEETVLLRQNFVKNPDQTIQELIESYIAKLGENIQVGGFVRYEI